MGLISLKCPNCAGDIQLDEKKEFGFCMHCGNKVMIEDNSKQKVIISQSDKVIENWITLGKFALKSKNYKAAEDYAMRVLENDVDVGIAWLIKGCAVAPESGRSHEAYECFERSFGQMSNDEKKENFEMFLFGLSYLFDEKKLPAMLESYMSGFDRDIKMLLYREGSSLLFKESKTGDGWHCRELIIISMVMLMTSSYLDGDSKNILADHREILEILNYFSVKFADSAYSSDVSNMKELIRHVVWVLYEIVSKYSDEDRKAAAVYWSENEERHEKINNTIEKAGDAYTDACKQRFGSGDKKRALETIKKAYLEIAYPNKKNK